MNRRTRAPPSATVGKVQVLVRPIWRPVTGGNCALATGGGEQPEVKTQSVAPANALRPAVLTSPRVTGEVPMASARCGPTPDTPTGRAAGGWRRNGPKVRCREGGRPGGLRTR